MCVCVREREREGYYYTKLVLPPDTGVKARSFLIFNFGRGRGRWGGGGWGEGGSTSHSLLILVENTRVYGYVSTVIRPLSGPSSLKLWQKCIMYVCAIIFAKGICEVYRSWEVRSLLELGVDYTGAAATVNFWYRVRQRTNKEARTQKHLNTNQSESVSSVRMTVSKYPQFAPVWLIRDNGLEQFRGQGRGRRDGGGWNEGGRGRGVAMGRGEGVKAVPD